MDWHALLFGLCVGLAFLAGVYLGARFLNVGGDRRSRERSRFR